MVGRLQSWFESLKTNLPENHLAFLLCVRGENTNALTQRTIFDPTKHILALIQPAAATLGEVLTQLYDSTPVQTLR